MTDLRRRLIEDRAMRDTARSIIHQQLSRVRSGVSGKWLGEKLADRYGDRLIGFAATARQSLRGKGGLAAGVGAIAAMAAVAWFARYRLRDLLGSANDEADPIVPRVSDSEERDEA